uniref:Uncharacterized protein n=1 Tax=Arundo donax TaxID=35708 RepID=A0A0A9CN25_ARUDO
MIHTEQAGRLVLVLRGNEPTKSTQLRLGLILITPVRTLLGLV